MSKGHTAVNEFLENKVRYADLFNGSLFQGRQIILAEELELVKGESDILVEDKDENTLIDYMHANEEFFRHVDSETYRVIGELLQSKKILNSEVSKEEEGEKDMCKALEDLYQHGKIDKLRELVAKKLEKGLSATEIAEMLEEKVETIEKIVNETTLDEADRLTEVTSVRYTHEEVFGKIRDKIK